MFVLLSSAVVFTALMNSPRGEWGGAHGGREGGSTGLSARFCFETNVIFLLLEYKANKCEKKKTWLEFIIHNWSMFFIVLS